MRDTSMNKLLPTMLFIIALLVLIYLVFVFNKHPSPQAENTNCNISDISIDSIKIPLHRHEINMIGVGQINYTDTTIPEFVSQLDTIITNDTFHLEYAYPLNLFTMTMLPGTDSVVVQQIVIKQSKESWWIKPTIGIGAVAIGVLIGRAIK